MVNMILCTAMSIQKEGNKEVNVVKVFSGWNYNNQTFFSDIKRSAAVAKREEPRSERGPLVEDKAVQELRSLGKDLQALRLQVEQQLGGTSSSEEWIQVGFTIDRLLFGLYILFISVSFITIIIIWVNSYRH